jgi:hypothetical protein
MANKLMNLKYQIQSEAATKTTTTEKYPAWFSTYPTLIDTLFEVTYFIGTAKDPTSPEGHFYFLGTHILTQLPYTIRATCILIEKGFYAEAIALIRTLFEALVQLRYFHKHKELGKNYMLGKKILIKTMFEEIIPGFYDKVYKTLSVFPHAKFQSTIFRIEYTQSESQTKMGNEFNEVGFGYAVTKIWVILLGILNYIPLLFPQYSDLATEQVEVGRKEVVTRLEFLIKTEIELSPKTKGFFDLVTPLIRVETLP